MIAETVHFVSGTTRRELVSSMENFSRCASQWNRAKLSSRHNMHVLHNPNQTLSRKSSTDTMEQHGIFIPSSDHGAHLNRAAGPWPVSWRQSAAAAAQWLQARREAATS